MYMEPNPIFKLCSTMFLGVKICFFQPKNWASELEKIFNFFTLKNSQISDKEFQCCRHVNNKDKVFVSLSLKGNHRTIQLLFSPKSLDHHPKGY